MRPEGALEEMDRGDGGIIGVNRLRRPFGALGFR